MSDFQTFVRQRLTELTNSINNFITNGKKIDELSHQSNLVPESKLHVSRAGTSEFITIQQIINASSSNSTDKIISIGTITLSGNDLTVPAGITWQINNSVYTKNTDTIINIPFSASGLNRKDIIVANTSGNIIRIVGEETAGGIVVAPTLPLNSILITEINVSDSIIQDPIDPITEPLSRYNTFKFIQKGFGKENLSEYEIGDHFCGHSNDGTIRYSDAIWLGGPLNNSDNFKPLVQTEIS